MEKIVFTKITGAGNDFILIDKKLNQNFLVNPDLIKSMCDRRYGIGADGILIISDCDSSDFEMEFFNSDGSSGMLCGNGARCIIKYADSSGRISGTNTTFTFNGESFSGSLLDDDLIKFQLNSPTKLKQNFEITLSEEKLKVSFIDTGAFHVVVNLDEQKKVKEIESYPVNKIGREIRFNDKFKPLGTNVNFITVKNNIINIRTYERGVEEETLACGTGSVASAIISYLEGKIKLPAKVKTKSGEILVVDFKQNGDVISNVSLTGTAKIVFKGKYKL
jgi:diaminopimelate epimerase